VRQRKDARAPTTTNENNLERGARKEVE
jgi:hypothetical protein